MTKRQSRLLIKNLLLEICGAPNVDIDDALSTAQLAHLGQTRRSGEDYIEHPKEVARIVYSFYGDPILCAAALLHDSLEDAVAQGNFESTEELKTMISASFGDPRVGAEALRIVQSLTHNKSIPYDEYVLSLLGDTSALRVKLSDMLHNLRSNPSPRQLEKYSGTLQALQNASGGIPHGINQTHWNALQSAASNKILRAESLRRAVRHLILEEKEPIRMPLNLPTPEDLRIIHQKMKAAGMQLYVVGGAVRDTLMNKLPKDYDLATNAPPEEVIKILEADPSLKIDLTGKSFGVVRVVTPENNEYEIATFRKDIGKGRRPDSVEFTSIEDDVNRRDLTINALFYDLDTGEAVDYVGGIEDIQNGIIRAVGDPVQRFDEDRLRILRAVRFAGRMGSDLDSETKAAILDDNDLSGVSPERIRDEFIKGIISAQSLGDFLALIDELHLFPQIFPGLSVSLDKISSNKDSTVQVALLLTGNDSRQVENVLRKMKYTNQEIDTIKFLHNFVNVTPEDAPRLKKEFNRVKISEESIRDFADAVGSPSAKAVDIFLKFSTSPPAANPRDLMAKGLHGPEIGAAIQNAEIESYASMLDEIRHHIRALLMEVPLDDFEYVSKDHDNVIVREEVADYFKAIPQSVNIYVAHTDDLSWAHRLPNEIQGKVFGFKSRGQVGLTDIANIGKLYPQIQRAMNPEGINLLYIYPKSYEVPSGGDSFIADVNPHYLAHDLHHMLESMHGLGNKEKDAFSALIKEYLLELVWLSHGGGTMEAEQVRHRMQRTGRKLGVTNPDVLLSELFPGVNLPSGDFDLFGDIFADYLKNDGNLVLGVPEQLNMSSGDIIELSPGPKHDQRAQQYEKKFKDLFDTVLDPLKGKVALFNIFEVEHQGIERAKKQAEEKMQADHGPILDHIKSMGGEFLYFDESYKEEGTFVLVFNTGLKPEEPIMKVEEFTHQFPKEAASIESLGYKIAAANGGLWNTTVEVRLKQANMEENVLRKYVRQLLKEDPMGFVHDLAASDKFGDQFRGGQVGKDAGRDIKRAFNKNADHQFLSTLDTVHWMYDFYGVGALKGKGKDEISVTMTLPGDGFIPAAGLPYGLWVKGRITLAANEQDNLYTGFYGDYGAPHEASEEEVAHRDKSSGRNKRPSVSKDYSRYGQLQRGNEYMEKMARDGIPYILDQSTWDPGKTKSNNEALVDNWRPVGIIVAAADIEDAILKTAEKLVSGGHSAPSGNTAKDIEYFSAGAVKQVMLTANELGIPVYDAERNKLWSPKQDNIKEVRETIREILRKL